MATVQVERKAAEALFQFIGWHTFTTWKNDRMAQKLKQVKDLKPEKDPTDEDIAATMVKVLAGIEEGAEFEVVGDDTSDKSSKPQLSAEEQAKSQKEKEDQKAAKQKEKEDAKAAKQKEKDEAKAAKQKERDEAKTNRQRERKTSTADGGIPGVRLTKNRVYHAGAVIKKHGLKHGITPDMLKEVDELSGKPNEKESRLWLSVAWHCLNGYLQEVEVPGEESATAPESGDAA